MAGKAPEKSGWGSHLGLWLVCVVAVTLMHVPFLRLPYYWDEAGYYFPAALELAQHGRLIPQTTMVEVHPPLQTLYLAAFYKVFGGAPLVTRLAMCLVSGAALYALLLLAALLVPAGAGLWATCLLMVSPLFFAQSTLAHIDVAATAATLLALYFYLRGRVTGYLIAASALCLTRETGAFLVILLAMLAWRSSAFPQEAQTESAAKHWLRQGLMLAPLLPLAAWLLFLRLATGHWLGDANFVAYNVQETLNPLRFLVTLLRRLFFLFVGDFRWTLTFPALLVLWRGYQRDSRLPPARPGHRLLWMVVALQVVVMSIFGGAILERYLLPALALFYLLAIESLERLQAPHRRWSLLALTLAQVACWYWNPPYPFPYEENLAYADFVNLHEAAGERATRFPAGTRILTVWPASAEFLRPELGYVKTPVKIVGMPDFSEGSFDNVQAEDFDVLFMYSAEWRPPFDLLREYPLLQRIREDLYHRHPPMDPVAVRLKYNLTSLGAIRLHGQWVEWMERSDLLRRPLLGIPPSPRESSPPAPRRKSPGSKRAGVKVSFGVEENTNQKSKIKSQKSKMGTGRQPGLVRPPVPSFLIFDF
jgi:hypothetical protein